MIRNSKRAIIDIEFDDLEEALYKCQAAASRGYEIAKINLVESSKAIREVSKSLNQCMQELNGKSVRTNSIVIELKKQLSAVVNELENLQDASEKNLEERRLRLDRFSITLFGRTMAGKSTIMEILTHGDGKSIGSGAQRTTRDVRSYEWKTMEITDVPGIAAFEGAEDERLAFESALQADLVIFLITDDAPQPIEAECLAQVRRLGKPVLGICNVKVAIDDKDDLTLFLRNQNHYFERTRINQLLDQFHAFADQYNPGKRIPFVVTHLRARYLADCAEYSKYRDELLRVSRFNIVESLIIQEVVRRGIFLRTKSFIDGVVTPIIDLTDKLLDFSAQNSTSGRVLIDKRRQFQEWAQNFENDGQERINTFVSKLMNSLRADALEFSEDHYNDKKAGEQWNKHIESIGLNEKIMNLQQDIQKECKKALTEVARELNKELSLVGEFAGDKRISMASIFDSKRVWNWSTLIISSGIGLAAIILGSNPLGWVAAGIGLVGWLVSFLFDSREEKIKNATRELNKSLQNNIDKMEHDLQLKLTNWFHQELIEKQVRVLIGDFSVVTSGLFALADAQRNLAWTLNERQKVLGQKLIEEALLQLDTDNIKATYKDVARIPGFATMLLIDPSTAFPSNIKDDLERLLGEVIWFVIDTGREKSILAQAIGYGCERDKIGIERNLKVAHVPIDELDVVTRSRVKLAQQLTGLHVTK